MSPRSRMTQVARLATYLAALLVLLTARAPTGAPLPGAARPGSPEMRHRPDLPAPQGTAVLIRVLLGGVLLAGLVMDAGGRRAWR